MAPPSTSTSPPASSSSSSSAFGPAFTTSVISSMGPNTHPRLRTVLTALIQHLHSFAREVDLSFDEWLAGVELVNWAGKMSDDKRNEGILLCDVLGLESLVDALTFSKPPNPSTTTNAASITQSAVLGPFFRHDHPVRRNGDSIILSLPKDGQPVYLHGSVIDGRIGNPISNASIDIWQGSTNGLYEQQDPAQPEHNLRGKFFTDDEGKWSCYCLRPTPYPVPSDGPAGKLLKLMDRHPYRPAHIHLMVRREGYKPVTTQIFDQDSKYIEDDAVFAVKSDLTVRFVPRQGDEKAQWELGYDVVLAPVDL